MARGSARIQVRGAKEFRAAMKSMGADLKDLTAVNRHAAEIVASRARSIAPIMTGALVKSIKPTAGKSSARVKAGGTLVPYAGVIHFGWPAHNIEAQPYLWNAMADEERNVVQSYEREVEALVRKVGEAS